MGKFPTTRFLLLDVTHHHTTHSALSIKQFNFVLAMRAKPNSEGSKSLKWIAALVVLAIIGLSILAFMAYRMISTRAKISNDQTQLHADLKDFAKRSQEDRVKRQRENEKFSAAERNYQTGKAQQEASERSRRNRVRAQVQDAGSSS